MIHFLLGLMVCLLEKKKKKKKLEEEENIKWAQDKLICIILMSSTSPVTVSWFYMPSMVMLDHLFTLSFSNFGFQLKVVFFLLYCIYLCDECELVSRLYFLSRMSYEDKKNGGNTRVKILDTYNN